jgi:hypothetical protein
MPCFHSKCFGFKVLEIGPIYCAAIQYQHPPAPYEEKRRFERIRHLFRLRIATILGTLPIELQDKIVGYLIRECATITNQLQISGPSVSDSVISLSRNVYAIFHFIDGIRYIQRLYNTEPEPGQKAQLLLDVRKKGPIQKVLFAEDLLGIRLVKFLTHNITSTEPQVLQNGWWRNIDRQEGITELKIITDVSIFALKVFFSFFSLITYVK